MEPISSEDPKAIELLTEKLEKLEKQREEMKAINKDFKQAKGEASKMKIIPEHQREKIIAMVANAPSYEKAVYPAWAISNLGANIRTVKQRIAKLVVVAKEETSEYTVNGVRVVDNCEEFRLQLFFDDKPEPEIRTRLKSNGFRWTPSKECWQSYRGRMPSRVAKDLVESLPMVHQEA